MILETQGKQSFGWDILGFWPGHPEGAREVCQVGMNGDTFSIKTPKNCSKKFVAILKGNSLPEDIFLESCFVLRRIWSASIEKVSPLKSL